MGLAPPSGHLRVAMEEVLATKMGGNTLTMRSFPRMLRSSKGRRWDAFIYTTHATNMLLPKFGSIGMSWRALIDLLDL